MPASRSSRTWFSLVVLTALFLSPSLLQGCDAVVHDDAPSETPALSLGDLTQGLTKLAPVDGLLPVDNDWAYLIVGVNEEPPEEDLSASGVTRRKLNSYTVTRRVLNKYGEDAVLRLDLVAALQATSLAIRPSVLQEVLRDLEQDPDVAWVELDRILSGEPGSLQNVTGLSQQVSWSVSEINAPRRPATGVDVFVVDSGVNASSEFHLSSSEDYSMYYVSRLTGTITQLGTTLGLDPLTNNLLVGDLQGHGTAVAGTIAAKDNTLGVRGAAPGTALHNLRVLGPDGQTDMSTVLKAIDDLTARKQARPDRPMVVNLSLGADFGTTELNAMDRAIQRSIEAGVVYVIAAGNEGIDVATVTPAHVPEAITVGAYDRQRHLASFSNHGAGVDILAPGVDVVSVSHLSPWKRVRSSGTSFAAPHVTALAAHYLAQYPTATPEEVLRALVSRAKTDLTVPAGTTSLRAAW